jgi:hypothetical protein
VVNAQPRSVALIRAEERFHYGLPLCQSATVSKAREVAYDIASFTANAVIGSRIRQRFQSLDCRQ